MYRQCIVAGLSSYEANVAEKFMFYNIKEI